MMHVEKLEEIKRNTRALLGKDEELSYITETLLAEMERTGVEISSDSPFGADHDRTYHSCRIVDAVCYVAFQVDGVDAAKDPGEARIVWLEKPVQIDRAGYCPDGQERYAIRDLPMPAAWENGALASLSVEREAEIPAGG